MRRKLTISAAVDKIEEINRKQHLLARDEKNIMLDFIKNWISENPNYGAASNFYAMNGKYWEGNKEIPVDLLDIQGLHLIFDEIVDIDLPYDCTGRQIHKGNIVKWKDPEFGKWSKITYEVYEEPNSDMVRLWSPYGECEALPEECKIIKQSPK